LNSLIFIGGGLNISYNDALTNLIGLDNLTSIGFTGLNINSNQALTTLMGIDNIDAGSITDLWIFSNDILSECEVQCVCDYLLSPNGEVSIYDNATGCDSQEEVEEACETVSIVEISMAKRIVASPNPFTTSTTLSYELKEPSAVQLSVFNQLGKLVYQYSEKHQGIQKLQWHAKDQPEGLYYYRIQAGNQIAKGKLIKVK
jgi:hypothetical protein